jgi:hypothetical protein
MVSPEQKWRMKRFVDAGYRQRVGDEILQMRAKEQDRIMLRLNAFGATNRMKLSDGSFCWCCELDRGLVDGKYEEAHSNMCQLIRSRLRYMLGLEDTHGE